MGTIHLVKTFTGMCISKVQSTNIGQLGIPMRC